MFILTQNNEPVSIVQVNDEKRMQKYMHKFCLNLVNKMACENTQIDQFNDFVMGHESQMHNYDDGYYFMIPSDNCVEIYKKTTGEEGWLFRAPVNVVKEHTFFYTKYDKGIVKLPNEGNFIAPTFYDELSNKLADRRTRM